MVSGEKRNSEEERMVEKVTTVLLDIEGTTTSISFVKDKLFPYVREQLQSYVDSHWENDEFKKDLQALKDQAKKDEEDKVEGLISIEDGEKEKESLIKNITWQMDLDRKTTALKQLQGHIWREGYENGKLKGHIYDDVASCLKKWSEDGRRLFVYSSGSVEAQKLLFKNTEEGDLLEFLAGHYDTTVGPKTESSSYESIAKSIGCDSEQILFLTDVVKEAQAAKSAGFQTLIVVREGNAELSEDDKKEFVTISSFKEIVFESSAKKKKVSNGEESIEEPEKVEKEKATEEKMESEPEEKKTEPAPEEKKDVNGEKPKEAEEEKMEVDVVVEDEVKPAETISEDCKKTAEPTEIKTDEKIVANNETEESNKTESEKVAVDVVETKEEEKKEEEKKKEDEKEAAPAEDNEKKVVEEEKAKEEEVKVTKEEPAKEIEKPEETKEESKPKEETKPEEEKKPEAEEKKEEVKEAEKKEEEPKVEVENNKEESENHKVETEDKKEEKEEKKEEAESKKEVTENNKDETENKTEEKKEMNGKTNGQENGEKNGVPETEEITVKKVLPEETPDTAVEVKA